MAQITKIDPVTFEAQSYSPQDEGLILTFPINTELQSTGYIEFYVYDFNNNLINQDINFKNYKIENSGKSDSPDNIQNIIISPEENLKDFAGTGGGQYIGFYNFLNYEIGNTTNQLFISEISSDRTEIRLESNSIPNLELVEIAEDFIDKREESEYFVDFYLNFGNNTLIIANNIKIENEETDNPSILVKLYEPLSDTVGLKTKLFIVTTINEPEAYRAYFEPEPTFVDGYDFLKGPNFAIPIKDQVNNSSQNLSYTDIISSASTGSQNQIDSLLSQSAINISVDYNNFSDFINFSSVQTRIENFYYKVGLIETYTSESNALTNTTGSTTSKQIIESKISNVITNFDKFEYFMYYSSGSMVSYPKSTTEPPYILMSTGSTEVLTWLGSVNENSGNFGGLLLSASNYDNENPDQLKKAIPEYLREDPANQPYDLFVDMVAQYYDNIWLYTKDITQKYNADNRLDFGVSKDLVSDAIKDFGVKLYQNNFSNKELYTAFLGMTPNGSLFPFPEITGSLPAPTGFEFVDTLISASNDVISMDDTNKSLYKRIYHNIPYLLKSKGTLAGLRALITSYGIPDTILKISEFGGKDQVNANDYDLYFNNFNYAFNTENNFISSSWQVNSDWGATGDRPSTVQFRFKSEKFPPTSLSQSLWNIQRPGGSTAELLLDYSGSGLDSGSIVNDSGSYDGSIKDPNYQVANLRFIPSNTIPNVSASISLPFYNGDWWSVMVVSGSEGFSLYAGNKIYNGNDGTSIGYFSSSLIAGDDTVWTTGNVSNFASSSGNFIRYNNFSGSLQEIRYYKSQISENVFKDYVMNPLSFEGNGVNDAPDQLIFRAALGSELDINTSSSIHPKVTGSWTTTSSFASDSNFYFSGSPQYYKNTEILFLDQPAAGIKNRTTDKIRSENATIPGDTLSPIRSLAQTTEASASYTDNINYLEVAFSPQNQINDDIIGQMGHFNIGDYIGDPAQRFSGNVYPDLNNLSEEYFKKYIKQYDLVDFVRLIKFFDNSLFKMVKDFIPARTSLASGLVVKQHLLERNKYPQPQVTQSLELLTGSIQSKQIWDPATSSSIMSSSLIESFNGGAAGMFNPFNISYDLDFISQSVTTNFTVSASSEDNLPGSLNDGDTFISGADGPPVTNASSLSYFSTFVPNLYVQLNSSGGTLVPFAFNSGSKPGPNTNVSASGRFSSAADNNTFDIFSQATNISQSIISNYQNFRTEGFIRTTPAIFNNPDGNVLTSDSDVTSLTSTQISTTFSTQSVSTNVSASGTITYNTEGGGLLRFNLSSNQSNVSGNDMTNFQTFKDGYITTTNPIFSGSGPSTAIASASVSVLGSGLAGFRITGQLSPVLTPVSGSGGLSFATISPSTTTFTTIPETTNVTGGKLFNFDAFEDGYITTTNPIFSGSGPFTAINSASISSISNFGGFGLSGIVINAVTSSVITLVSASGVAGFGPNPGIPGDLRVTSSITNATDLNFSGFDDGNAYISCSSDAFGQYPFTGGLTGTGIALITSCTNTGISVSISGRNGEYSAASIQFHIMSGSAASVNSFISASQRPTISSEPFQIRSGSISQGTSGPIIFTSESIRNGATIIDEPFIFRTGSISQGTAGSTTFVSSSARNLSGVDFEFRSGSIGEIGDTTTYISSSLLPLSHSRAQVASIGANDVINFATDWSINNVGALNGEEFQLFDNATGSGNTFASSSTVFEYRNNQLNPIPPPIFNITQSYNETFSSILGPVTTVHDSQDEFYDGELSGSAILVSNGELNEGCADFKEVNPFLADYKVRTYSDATTGVTEGKFLSPVNLPLDGYIQIFYGDEPGSPLAPVLPESSRI